MESAIFFAHFSVDFRTGNLQSECRYCVYNKSYQPQSAWNCCCDPDGGRINPEILHQYLTTIPYCVLGGATISVFASIAMTGMKLITTEPMDFRNTTVVGLAVAVGMGVTQASASLAQFPDWVTTIFGKSPVVLATIVAIVLNLTLPKAKK